MIHLFEGINRTCRKIQIFKWTCNEFGYLAESWGVLESAQNKLQQIEQTCERNRQSYFSFNFYILYTLFFSYQSPAFTLDCVRITAAYVKYYYRKWFIFSMYILMIWQTLSSNFRRDDTVTFASVFPFFSFGFMVFSTNAVMFCAARINDHSKIILPNVFKCPASKFTSEVCVFPL